MTNRSALFAWCLVIVGIGCTPSGSSMPVPQQNAAAAPATLAVALTPITRTNTGASFDPKTVAPGSHTFSTDREAVRINMHGRRDGVCQFDYIVSDSKGAYTWNRVKVPVEIGLVTINVGEHGLETSFPQEAIELLWSGDGTAASPGEKERMAKIPTNQQEITEGRSLDNYYRDDLVGEGAEAVAGSDVVVRYRVFANEYFEEPLPGYDEPRVLHVRLGDGRAGTSVESAVVGMKVGGKRRVMIWEQLSAAVREEVGGWQPDKQMPVVFELVKVK